MRLNRGTIGLIVVALVVIIGVAVFNNNQAAAPGTPTATPGAASGPLWQGIDQNNVVRLEVRDNHTGQAIVLSKAQNGGWDVTDSAVGEQALSGAASSVHYVKPQNLPVDTARITSSVGAFAGLQAADHFDVDTPADFGVDKPLYTIYAATSTGAIYAIHVGNKNPNNTRYYVTIQQIAGASTTPEATEMQQGNAVIGQGNNTSPVATAVPAVTEMVGADPTINALATAIVEATSEAGVTEAAQALATAVSATNDAVATQVAPAATMDSASTAEATGGAVATSEVRLGAEQANGTVVAATAPALPATEEATAAATAASTAAVETTPEATPVVLAEPLVVLTGKQTVYLVPTDVIGGMITFLGTAPYVYPTATPTLPPTANPYSEVQQTATAVVVQAQQMGTLQALYATVTARAMTAEATAAATAAAGATSEATPAP